MKTRTKHKLQERVQDTDEPQDIKELIMDKIVFARKKEKFEEEKEKFEEEKEKFEEDKEKFEEDKEKFEEEKEKFEEEKQNIILEKARLCQLQEQLQHMQETYQLSLLTFEQEKKNLERKKEQMDQEHDYASRKHANVLHKEIMLDTYYKQIEEKEEIIHKKQLALAKEREQWDEFMNKMIHDFCTEDPVEILDTSKEFHEENQHEMSIVPLQSKRCTIS